MGDWYVWPVDANGRELASVSVVVAPTAEEAIRVANRDLVALRDMPRRASWLVTPADGTYDNY